MSTPKARLGYYAERFDTVEVDSPYYHLFDPDVTSRWAQRTPPEFTFHVKAHASMTGHEPAEQASAFAAFRASLEPLELSGKLRGILLQYHPRVVKSAEAKRELEAVRDLLERNGLAYVSVDAPRTRASNVVPPVAADTPRRLRPLPRT